MIKLKIIQNSILKKNDPETLKRIADKHVGYMEISEEAKGFVCGDCRSIDQKDFCVHPDVKAYVSAKHGCCNYFYPKKAKVIFPKQVAEQQKLVGGLGDKKSLEDFDPKEVQIGLEVEMEHTKDKNIASEIVTDHLSEDPNYYSKLKKAKL
jgi:hypothetical protein